MIYDVPDDIEQLYDQYRDEGHLILVIMVYDDRDRLELAHLVGDDDYPADEYAALCDCGADTTGAAGWEDVRWWAREHRISVGLAPQQWIPNVKAPRVA